MGVHISIDDFGTGYSSLSYLKKLPIDTLKIDRSFIQDIPKDEDNMAITTSIISMGKHLKKKVVAEGVEEESQVQFLLEQGCHEYQGFYCSPPTDPERIELLLKGLLFLLCACFYVSCIT
jgi:EAL domain-containing protein (putative c-di-GMP-specific phosphodiesterase class I)